MMHHGGGIRRALATDFDSGRMIPAHSAYYDEGGNLQYCTAMRPPVERGPQGLSPRVYDRCLPSLVAFKTPAEAEAYQKEHGGRVLDYSEVVQSMKE
jgi:hypothetical protein